MAHEFSPIISEDHLQAAAEYLTRQSLLLAKTVLGQKLTIDTLCFFTHSPEEYQFIEQAVRRRGPESRFSHEPTLYVDTDFTVLDQHVRIFGVRKPDPARLEIGYGDYPVAEVDYQQLLHTAKNNPHMREITSGRGKSLVELRHPDFDVLGYVVDQTDHAQDQE